MTGEAIPPGFRARFVAADALPERTLLEGLVDTCALHDLAKDQIAARIRREHPGVSEAVLAALVKEAQREWLQSGDIGPGRPVPWPRS